MVEISRCGGEFCVVLAVVLGSVLLLVVARRLVSPVIMCLVVVDLCVRLPHIYLWCESLEEISLCEGEICILAVLLGSVLVLVGARELVSLVVMSLVVVELCVG